MQHLIIKPLMEDIKLIPLDLAQMSEEVIAVLLLDSTVEPSFFDEVARKNTHRPHVLKHLLTHPKTPPETRQFIAGILRMPVPEPSEVEPEPEVYTEETGREFKTQRLLQRVQKLKVGERIQLALRGSRDIRSILLRDSSKEVVLTVLENPKITESEIEILVKQRTTPEEVIRNIAKKREWLKNYAIVHALVTNPKTPLAIALKYVPALKHKDLSLIEKDKNISGAIRTIAKKLISRKPT